LATYSHLLRPALFPLPPKHVPLRRLALQCIAFGIALLSCGRDVTGPGSSARYARGITFNPVFPPAFQAVGGTGSGVVEFNRVHIVLDHDDGTVALDTVVNFPADSTSLTLSLTVQLLADAPASGEPLSLNLGYINAAGDTVFKGGPVTVTATPSVVGGAPPAPVSIPVTYTGPGASAVAVQISPRQGSVNAGQTFTFNAVAVDGNGAPVANTPIVWNSLDPSIASMQSAAAGVVVAQNARGTARIVAQLLTGPTDQVTLTVQPVPTALAVQSGSGQSALGGTTLTQPLVAIVTAGDGLGVSGVTVNFAVASGGGSVGASSVVTNSAGVAQTTWKLGNTPGTQTVTAASGALSGSPATFTATAKSATAAKLVITSDPANAVAGATLAPLTVVAEDAAGDTSTAFTGAITITLANGTAGAALNGTATANAVAGIATFANLTVNKSGTAYTLAAASAGLTGATSTAFNIAAGSASQLAFTAQPVSNTAGNVIGNPITVAAEDQYGNTVTSFTGTVTIAIATNPGGGVLGGTTSAAAVAGVATFTSLTINHQSTGYTLTATTSGLTPATSAAFDVLPGGAANLAVVSGANQSANINAELASPVTVQVTDLGGNGIAGKAVTFAVVSGGGSLSSLGGVSDVNGNVSTNWMLGATVGTQAISATATGLAGSPLTINATGVTTPNHFVVTTQPAATDTAGLNVGNGLVVAARDPSNNPIPGFVGTVTLALGANPGGATISGTTSVSAVAGVATFSGFSLNKAGSGYTLTANSAGYTGVTSNTFTVVAGAASNIAINGGNAQTAAPSALLPTAVSVLVTDANANPVAGRVVTWAVTNGGGSLDSTTSVTNASGIASRHWTLGSTGSQTVTATSSGLTGSPVTFTATFGAGVASTTVAPKNTSADTLTAIGATLTATAQAKDALGNNVAGTYAWVSRTPSVATVTPNGGLITAVANGSTWIVATESGGTKDSAQIIVQQRLATINVAPTTRNIYLGATSPAFTATAVDGLGVALVAQPTFKWSSVTPTIATIDSLTAIATGTGLGSTQVQAKSGAVTGVATLNVVTRIKNIYVARDSAGFSQTASDTVTLVSLGVNRSYRAFAYDSLSTLLSGITFTFATSNASVASLDSIGTVTVRALTAANGTTSISATAQGVTGAASLKVQQVLHSITLQTVNPASPTSAIISASGGTAPLTARGLDANGKFISGGTFTDSTDAPGIATVDASGIVHGVAIGTAHIFAKSGTVVSNPDTIAVANVGVPAALSFGRDTIAIGRGTSSPTPVLLSTPSASAITLLLSARDTNAYFSSAKVSVSANTTSLNVTLNGRNAGTTVIYVQDSAGVYARDSAVVTVQANMHIAQSSWSLNATDQTSSQVILSDPSPAGGTYVTFSYGNAAVAQVSPSPAFIPAGQLSANIVISALTAGSTTITPVATGVNGTASTMNVAAPVANFSGTYARVGAGQYQPNLDIYLPNYTNFPVSFTLSSSDTTIATVSPTIVTIPANSYYAYYNLTGIAPGSVTISATAAGWTLGNSETFVVTTPHVGICCGTTLNTTSPTTSVTVYAEDSTKASNYSTNSLVVHLSSSNPAVMTVIDSVVTIPAGLYYYSGARVMPGGSGGTAYIKATASGHTADSTLFTVVGPKLSLSWSHNVLGVGQYDQNLDVQTPNNVTAPLAVTLTHSDSTKTSTPTQVTVLNGSYYVYFNVTGKALGTDTIIATAPGYSPDTAVYTVSTPQTYICCSTSYNNFGAGGGLTIYATDSLRNTHYQTASLVVSVTSLTPSVVTVDSSVATIPASSYYNNARHLTPVGVGTAKIVAMAAGYTPDTITVTVNTPKLSFSWYSTVVGRRQRFNPTDFNIETPDDRTSPLVVTITQSNAAADSLTATSLTIPTSSYYQYFGAFGLAYGTDTLIASAPGYNPDTAFITVSTPHLYIAGITGSATTTSPPAGFTVYAEDSVGTSHYTMDTVVVRDSSSDSTVIATTQPEIRIPAGQYYVSSTYSYVGPGTAHLAVRDSAGSGYVGSTTGSVTVTGPSLAFSTTSIMLGMRQQSGPSDYYVYAPNNVASPLVVTLVSTDTTIATVPATVTIPTGSYYAYFQVVAHNATATIQIQASATGYGVPTPITVQVTQPQFVMSTNTTLRTTQGRTGITVYAEDANGNTHYVVNDLTAVLASASSAVATIDSASVVIPAGQYYNNHPTWGPVAVGSTQLTATDTTSASYKYNTGTANVAVTTPSLTFNSMPGTLGIGQYVDNAYVQVPDNLTAPGTVQFTHNGTAFTSTSTNLTNTPITSVTIPSASYYSYFRLTGVSAGTDSLVASLASPVENSAVAATTVGQGRIDPIGNWPTSLTAGDSVAITLYSRDPSQNARNIVAATQWTLAPSANIVFTLGGSVITNVTIPANAQSVTFYVKALSSGTASATITATNYQSYSNTFTVP
jgi:Bacterial Ig-like domain (group 1)